MEKNRIEVESDSSHLSYLSKSSMEEEIDKTIRSKISNFQSNFNIVSKINRYKTGEDKLAPIKDLSSLNNSKSSANTSFATKKVDLHKAKLNPIAVAPLVAPQQNSNFQKSKFKMQNISMGSRKHPILRFKSNQGTKEVSADYIMGKLMSWFRILISHIQAIRLSY